MSNILVHMFVDRHSEYDIFGKTDYDQMAALMREKRNGSCPNMGNRLWFQGLVSEISCEENSLIYFNESMTKDYINSNFDMIVAPMANVFYVGFADLLEHLAERFRDIRIPVYVIACGVQADSYNDLNDLCGALREPASAFIRSVYATGGEFALRGHFSKEFFVRLGFRDAVVTGCPSLYQLGRELQISNDKVSESVFRPILNGDLNRYRYFLDTYPGMEFFDQESYFGVLHDNTRFSTNALGKQVRQLISFYGYETTSWLLEGKVRLIPGMNDWREHLRKEGFNFSFGSRIHGNIMPILAGIPALLEMRDSRTREMAEFFDIPRIGKDAYRKADSLYELYAGTDYSGFNSSFAEKFDAYQTFLREHGIVKHINRDNSFFADDPQVDAAPANQEMLDQLAGELHRKRVFWRGYGELLRIKRTLV